ncbi:BTAD domain-containing putative transcriptional regulator [Streptoalloteichus hindustanus]|uniref:Predicted ATPase n=1 Tax=Streptoalloteichus hindustanus TaxID=2017 RepID=A0A1M5IH31_STRHI|nr:BTAD domain-containing putative transcriptional regulator [Streptoalloteichus hindustanus]SHG27103.1 Predicted ATPase [Streptoalloteichus hindustanus]
MSDGIRVALLGPVRAYAAASAIAIPGARVRLLLARLALTHGRLVPVTVLIDDLWGADALSDATNTLQALVSRLRKAVGAQAVELVGGGYRLAADVDAPRFEELVAQGRRELAADQPAAAIVSLDAALDLWTGEPLGDLPDVPFVRTAAARLDELRLGAVEDRCEAALLLGRHNEVLANPEPAARPLRERLAALRIRALYQAGRQSEALAAYEEVRRALADQLGVDPGADLRQVHLAMLRGELASAGARPKLTPGRLPAQRTSFVGRDAELSHLAEQLRSHRLVTVVGPGGVGKTRLAIEAAAHLPAHEQGRVWFVPLASALAEGAGEGPNEDADAVAGAVLGVLSATRARLTDGRPELEELIGPEPAVLVLDNCEHVVEAAARFTDRLLERLPRLTVLATSREPLAITGESLCRLDPLDPATDAVRLFVDRAQAVRPAFTADDAVLDICRRLDGLPLALELAAARLRTMTAAEIAHRLDDRFRLLASGSRAALPRHRTLLAVVDWSWDLLTEQERTLATRLSIFPGGATTVALEAVCADDLLPAHDIAYVLGSLVDKSLVQWDGRRHRMLETIRAYACDRLNDRKSIEDRFARYFLSLAEDHEPRLRTRDQLTSIAWFDAEYDNLLSALRGAINDSNADLAARLTISLLWYWQLLRFDARAAGFVADVLRFGDALPAPDRAVMAVLYQNDGVNVDPERARALIEDCISTGALERHPFLVIVTAPTAYFLGHRDLAERLLKDVEDHPDQGVAALAAWVRSTIRDDQGDWPGAAADRARALRGFEQTGERLGLSFVLAAVAQDHALRGGHDQAIAALTRCVALAAEIGSPEEISYRARLGNQRMRAGDLAGARQDFDIALRQAVEHGQPHLRVEALAGLADLRRREGEPERAGRLLDRLDTVVRGLPAAEQIAAAVSAPVRMALRIDTGDPTAKDLLPYVAATGATVRHMAAPAAELLARLLAQTGDATGAATALGMSQVIRGAFDHGNPELRDLVADLTTQLGATAYAQAYDRGAAMPRAEALARLHSG